MDNNELLAKALAGDLASTETVAESYFRGKNGFEENDEQALIWYQKALEIDPNSKTALTGLGSIYYNGYGVSVDRDKGIAFYLKGAYSGSGMSALRLAEHYNCLSDAQCIFWYEKAFDNGETSAAYKLYTLYMGNKFITADESKQLEWLEKGAEANDTDCQLALAYEYFSGGICKQDFSLALKWMLTAAENGSGAAMNNLAIMYTEGQAGEKNYEVALEWAIKGAKNGDASQLNRYALLYQDGDGFLPHMPEKGAELLQIGADSGNTSSMVFLSRAYLQGLGVETNEEKALSLLESAAKKGNKDAMDLLKKLGPRVYGDSAPSRYYDVVKEGADNGYYACMVSVYQCLSSGEGVAKNPEMAIKYLEEAARDDYKEAVFHLAVEHMSGKILKDADPKTAIELFEKVISLGEQDTTTFAAQRHLGVIYSQGLGVDKDCKKAISYIESAAEHGDSSAILMAALAHDKGGWADLNYEKSYQYYAQLAEKNNVFAINGLAIMYEQGNGVSKDLKKAAELYEKSAALGDARAMTNLAILLENEPTVGIDKKRSLELLLEAVKQGYPHAEVMLGFAYYDGSEVPRDLGKALQLWESAAKQGDSTAYEILGKVYADSAFEHVIDYEKAIAYFKPLAEQGNADAAFHLANCLGEISAWDEANEWTFKAAAGGNIEAQVKLGIYAWIENNYTDAVKWLQPLAERGNSTALTVMADMLLTGNSAIAKDEAKAIQYYFQAVEQGNIRAMYHLGRCYYFGNGIATNYDKAFNLFSYIANHGCDEMWLELGDCYLNGNGVGLDIDEAIKCYERGVERTECNFCRMRLGTIYSDPNGGYFNRKLAEDYLTPLIDVENYRAEAEFKLGLLCNNSGDIQGAVRWYMLASEENHTTAMYNLGVIFFNGDLGAQDLDKAERYFNMAARNGDSTAASDAADCRELRNRRQAQYQRSSQSSGSHNPQKSGGCYVATAVYGSYDCPEVWTLRRFRDFSLAETWYGRLFIRLYYFISPALVKIFGNCSWFKSMCRSVLDEMVDKLRRNGFEDTPYNDKKH